MNARVKLYQNLINDVLAGNISLMEVKELLDNEYNTWFRIYELEHKAKAAYKRYLDALKVLEVTKIKYENSVVDFRTKEQLYKKYSAAARRAEERFARMIQPLWDSLLAMGAVEEEGSWDPVNKIIQVQQYKERTGNNDLNIPVPFTPEEKIKIAVFGQKLKQKVVSFNNLFERTIVMEHNLSQHVTKPYTQAMLNVGTARLEMQQALKNKETAQIDYESYVLFSILGIL